MARPEMGNGDAFMRAVREAQQAALQQMNNPYNRYPLSQMQNLYSPQRHDPPIAGTPGEREAEDVTGLLMLEEFLAKRKEARKE